MHVLESSLTPVKGGANIDIKYHPKVKQISVSKTINNDSNPKISNQIFLTRQDEYQPEMSTFFYEEKDIVFDQELKTPVSAKRHYNDHWFDASFQSLNNFMFKQNTIESLSYSNSLMKNWDISPKLYKQSQVPPFNPSGKPEKKATKSKLNRNCKNRKNFTITWIKNPINRSDNLGTSGIRFYGRIKRHYEILGMNIKKKLLLELKNYSMDEVCKRYHISKRSWSRWKASGVTRKKGSGRKHLDPTLNERVFEWYKKQNKNNITSKILRNKAREWSTNKNFKASTGWWSKFKIIYGITLTKY